MMKTYFLAFGALVLMGLFSTPLLAQNFISYVKNGNSNGKLLLKNDTQPDNTVSLRFVLKNIEKSYHIKFAINDQLVEGKYLNQEKIKFGNLDKTLFTILNPFKLDYKIIDGYYVIQSKIGEPHPSVPMPDGSRGRISSHIGLLSVFANKQIKPLSSSIIVTGKVTSLKDKIPLPGVVVTIKGDDASGVVTGINGNYKISAPADNSILVFSHVGFKVQEVPVNNRNTIDIQLENDIKSLENVVIDVPYGKQTKASFTGSAVTLDEKELAGQPFSTFQSSLQGNVAGLRSIASTGQPGAMPTIRIRGITSLNGSVTPLYVIDGIPMVNSAPAVLGNESNLLGGLNPNDIETLTVLKDASATAIYGSRGANGVILITTKSGAAGKTKINISAQKGISKLANSKRSAPLTTDEMSSLLIEGIINNDFIPVLIPITTPEAAYQYLISQGLNPDVNINWRDVITQIGKYSQYNVSASGGNKSTNFYLSGGYYKQEALTKGQGYDRINARLSLENKASERLSFSASLSGSAQKLNTISGAGSGQNPVRSLHRYVPWIGPYTDNGEYNPKVAYNPEVVRRENVYETNIYKFVGVVGAEYKIIDPVSYEFKSGIDYSNTEDFRFWSPLWPDGRGVNGRGAEYNTAWKNWNITNLLKFRKQFNDLSFNAIIGQEASLRSRKRVSTQSVNYTTDGLLTLANASEPNIAWSDKVESSLVSYFLNTSFNYKHKYYLNATARRDGSSRFGKLARFGNFWSVGAAWNMHEEAFMSHIAVIDELKIRASYGLNGNQMDSYYNAQGYYATGANYGGEPGIMMASIENGNLRWETNKPFNVGVDFTILNRRLSGTIEWYSRTTSDLLMAVPISYANGVSSIDDNVGIFRNKGFELTLNAQTIRPKKEEAFGWVTSFNFSTQKNNIVSLAGEESITSGVFLREPGGDMYQFYMRGYAGVDRESGRALWFLDGTKKGTTFDISEAKSFKQGKSALPDFFGGLTNSFSYKRFTLSALMYFSWGGYVYDGWGTYTQTDGSQGVNQAGTMMRIYYENHWQKPGDDAQYPKVVYRGNQSGLSNQGSSRFLYDGSYIRLRDVSLSYDLPVKRWNIPVNRVEAYAKASNLFTYVKDKYLPYDPETRISGILDQDLPISRQILFGLNISF